jgi:hypothetical protein
MAKARQLRSRRDKTGISEQGRVPQTIASRMGPPVAIAEAATGSHVPQPRNREDPGCNPAGRGAAGPACRPLRPPTATGAARVVRRLRAVHVSAAPRRTRHVLRRHQMVTLVSLHGLVRRGQRIGLVGCTGQCHADHLHIEVHLAGQSAHERSVDPSEVLRRR